VTELEARVASELDRVREEVIETRRDLHRHPEPSLHEHRTAGIAAGRSEDLGFTVRSGVGGTGVIADLDGGGGDGPTWTPCRCSSEAVAGWPPPRWMA
jgi:metal-dependent amidase/aminoacylase/carboxypeptidase family protein